MKKSCCKPLKVVELDKRVTKLEESVYRTNPISKIVIQSTTLKSCPNLNNTNPAPNDSALNTPTNPDGAQESVYDAMRLWLASPAPRRVDEYAKAQSISNDLRQLLFLRNQKAIQKYGKALEIIPGIKNAKRVAEKLADGAFFLYQMLHAAGGIIGEEMKLVENLHTLLGLLIKEHKNKHQ